MSAESNEPTSISVEWSNIPHEYWGGQLLGYKIKYKKFMEKNFTVKLIPSGYYSSTLTGLKPYTLYWVEVVGYNSAGEGPPEYDIEETQQGGWSVPTLFYICNNLGSSLELLSKIPKIIFRLE